MKKTSGKINKSPMLGFYWRKLFVFAAFFAFAFFVIANVSVYKADINKYTPDSNTDTLNISMNVQKDGSILVDGQKISDRIQLTAAGDEFREPIIDTPGQYYSSIVITMTLPASVADNSQFELLAIHNIDTFSAIATDDRTIVYTALGVSSAATLTPVIVMPKGTISPPLFSSLYGLLNNLKLQSWLVVGIALPLLTLLYLLFFILYELRRHKIDHPTVETDAPPMALPPALVGVLYRQSVGPREIAATLIDLAVRGDVYIVDRERDFAFIKNKYDSRLLAYEKILLSKIFKTEIISDRDEIEKRINNHLYSHKMSLVTSGIFVLATRLGYFRINPQKIYFKYQLAGILIIFLGMAGLITSLSIFTNPPYIALLWLGMIASGIIIMTMAKKIPLHTLLGQESFSNWLAFRQYLSNPEKIPFSFENVALFQRYLPYAIVLDCEVTWARRFSEHNFELPAWFVSDRSAFGLEDFCLSLFPIVSYVSRSFASIREPGYK